MTERPNYRRRRLLLLVAIAILIAFSWWAWSVIDGEINADPRGAAVTRIEIESEAVGATEEVSVVVPADHVEQPPLLVFLHGRGNDEDSNLVDAMYEGLADLGERAPVVAFPDGGDSSYWHDRSSGDWGRYVVDEVIPAVVEETGADPDRVAIGGISMGGFGAFDLARLNPGEFCAVGGHSPAIWATAGETAAGAFDSAEDFAEHDLVTAAGTEPAGLAEARLWLDRGDADPFVPGADAFVAALQGSGIDIEAHAWPGGHDGDYWNAHWADYLRFYAHALAGCR
ncbi:MAG TPA: alpha/beta hydrolase-fold protein [Solirubrobacterales bacterium]|nr:alpha/beta hydrolase-fold protein [Solirubrobacterales bacterium]